MIVTLGSVRGAPGVTSWSLLLAAAWPSMSAPERGVLEADPAGGVLGVRYGLGVDPGAVSLIAALRRSADAVPVADHARGVGDGVWVVPGPETGEQSRAIWSGNADTVAARFALDDRVWLVDAGRLDVSSPALPFAVASSLTVLLTGSASEDLVQVPSRVAGLHDRGATVGVLVVGKVPHPPAELAEFFGTGSVWCAGRCDDLVAVAGAVLTSGRARRTWLWRTAIDVADDVAARAHQPAMADVPPSALRRDGEVPSWS
jgi:MinD-like ATPase involved in chromosome partitioning or flagellar assembly